MSLRPSIEEIRNLGMHASYYNWGLQFVSLPAALTGFTSADLNTRAVSFSAPTRTIDDAEINVRGHKVYQHAIVTYNTIELELHETIDSKVGNFLESWMDIQWTPISGIQVPKALNQSVILLTLLNSEDQKRYQYTLIGAWPTNFDHGGPYSANNSDTVKFTATLRYDYYLHNS